MKKTATFLAIGLLLTTAAFFAESFTKYTSGFVTIGDGTGEGIYKVTAFDSPAATMRAAVHHSGRLHFLRGTYDFTEPFVSGRSDMKISADPGAIFTISNEDAVGLFDLSGDNVTVEGLEIVVDTAVDDQAIVKMSGARCLVFQNKFTATTTDATTANPMFFVDMSGTEAVRVHMNDFVPKRGITAVRSTQGAHNDYTGNYFLPADTTVVEASHSDVTQNPATTAYLGEMYRGIDLQHDGWARVSNNTARMLGRPNATIANGAFPLDYELTVVASTGVVSITGGTLAVWGINPAANESIVIAGMDEAGNNGTFLVASVTTTSFTVDDPTGMVNETKSATGSAPTLTLVGHEVDAWLHMEHDDGAATNEGGHPIITGNFIEDIIAPAYVRALGIRWGTCTSNNFANSLSGVRTATEAAIVLDSEDGDGVSQPTTDFLISGNQFHNIPFASAATLGGDILLNYCNRVTISANNFSNNLGEYSVIITDPDAAVDWKILANTFEGRSYSAAGNQPTSAVHIVGASSAARYVVGGNTMEGYESTFITKDGSVTGAIFDVGLQDVSDGDQIDGSTTIGNLTTNIKSDQ